MKGKIMNRSTSRVVAALGLLAAISACSVAPVHQRPDVPVPANWDARSDGQAVTANWWKRFGSSELDRLMVQALATNHDLAAAVSRIEQARASASIARANLAPYVDAGVSASRRTTDTSKRTVHSKSDQALLSVGYEVDLWGANASSARAASARAVATVYDRDALALVLQSDVAANYFLVLALRDRLAIAHKNLAAAEQLMALVQVRFENGAATALDVAQQRTTLLSIQAEIPALEQSLRQTLNALAVLLGQPPQGFNVQGRSLAELTLPAVDAGQPADLLQRRPDIRTVEARLMAASADIGAARAALYPSINLSAAAGVEGILTGGTSTLASLAASLAQTIFDGGARRGQVQVAEASRKELVENYAQTVLTGLQEVEDSLIGVAASAKRSDILTQTTAQAREAYRLATVRYEAGMQDLLTVLDSQRSQLNAEDSLIQSQLARYTATVNLFKALGGGWENGTALQAVSTSANAS
jgi:NodT family efflux transporter outer membrane factor (OMF) lipoprotein